MIKNEPLKIQASQLDTHKRIDIFLREKTGISRRVLHKLFSLHQITLEGKIVNKSDTVIAGAIYKLLTVPKEPRIAINYSFKLNILYEDSLIIALYKPEGVSCQPLSPNEDYTIASFLVAYHPKSAFVGSSYEGGLCHRLDQYTSGVLIAAKNTVVYSQIREAFKKHFVEKEYLAICKGIFSPSKGLINESIMGKRKSSQKMIALPNHWQQGLPAETHYQTEEIKNNLSLMKLLTKTGRRHQIRVHLASKGHPILGDTLYKGPAIQEYLNDDVLNQQGYLLHASKLTLPPLESYPKGLVISCPLQGKRKEIFKNLNFSYESDKIMG